MIALASTKRYRSTHEQWWISPFKQYLFSIEKKKKGDKDRQIERERKPGWKGRKYIFKWKILNHPFCIWKYVCYFGLRGSLKWWIKIKRAFVDAS